MNNDELGTKRRGFLKMFGLSAAGVAMANSVQFSREKIKQGGDEALAEIEKLKKSYGELDRRSQFILRLILAVSGLDLFI